MFLLSLLAIFLILPGPCVFSYSSMTSWRNCSVFSVPPLGSAGSWVVLRVVHYPAPGVSQFAHALVCWPCMAGRDADAQCKALRDAVAEGVAHC